MRRLLIAAVFLSAAFARADERLYAASVRNLTAAPDSPVAGNLYSIDPGTRSYKLIASIRVAGTTPVAVTGLSDHPATGELYGITAEKSPAYPLSLVSIDLRTAHAKVIGGLGTAGTDIAFDPAGKLYVWLRETSQLGVIDLETGRASPIGRPGPASEIGGLAITADGTIYVASSGATGTLDRLDAKTGLATKGPTLNRAPLPGGINSLTIGAGGKLFAVNTNLGTPQQTLLVEIDPATGTISAVSELPSDTDALVFAQAPWTFAALVPSRRILMPSVAALLVVIALVALAWSNKRARGRR